MHRPALILTLAAVALGAAARLDSNVNTQAQDSSSILNPSVIAERDLNVNVGKARIDPINVTLERRLNVDAQVLNGKKVADVKINNGEPTIVNLKRNLDVDAQVLNGNNVADAKINSGESATVNIKRNLDVNAQLLNGNNVADVRINNRKPIT
ncbi:hypothetical protein BGZ76_005629, partial [Entomortierella beljakovae]